MTISETVEFLYEVPKFTSKNSQDHTREFMRRLGSPCLSAKVIHVAGSNGKGSVCNFIYHMILAGGKTAGLFSSPHLVDIRERFQVDGKLCSEDIYLKAFETVRTTVNQMVEEGLPHPTFFELLYGIGMLIFEWSGVEYVVLETGLGGRLDATNTYPHPIISIITSISLEHTEYLGSTLAEIAGEKAGIIKQGIPVVYEANEPEVNQVIERVAAGCGSQTYPVSKESYKILKIHNNCIDFSIFNDYDRVSEWQIPFAAPYQADNASIAIQAVKLLDLLSEEQMQKGLSEAVWPGRMQEILPDVYLDGAHNPSGIRVFLEAAKGLAKDDKSRPLLLFSMVKEKDYKTAIELLANGLDWETVVVTRIPDPRGLSCEQIKETFLQNTNTELLEYSDYKEAFSQVRSRKKQGQKIFCTGSLYFVGALLDTL